MLACLLGLTSIQQLQAQLNRSGIRKDTTSFNRNLDTLNQQQEDSVEVFELNYEEKYKSIRFTKSQTHFNYQNVDTLFDLVHQFDPINLARYKYNNIGIIGSPVYNLLPVYTSSLNFDLGFNQFMPYQIDADSVKIFNVNAPYTKLSWRFGSKAQQFFKVLHANRIKNIVQFGVAINRISGEGFYGYQRVRNSDLSAYITYNNKNKKYKLLSTLTTQSYVQEQHGGIREAYIGEIFDKVERINEAGEVVTIPTTRPHQRDLDNVPTYLGNTNAFGRNKGFNFTVSQYYNFGKYFSQADTDSTFIKRFVPQFRLKHKIAIIREENVFEASSNINSFQFYPTDLLYAENFYLDSIKVNKLSNQLALIQTGKSANNNDAINLPFKSMLSVNYERIKVKRLFADTLTINNTWLALNLKDNLTDKAVSFSIDAEYGLGTNNYQTNKFLLKATVNYQLPEPLGNVGLNYIANNYNAALLYKNYNSNFYQWQNNFDAAKINTAGVHYFNTKYNLAVSASFINFKNLPYFFYEDATDIDAVNLADGNLLRLQIDKIFTFGWWKMKHQLTYQTENNANIDLPNLVYNGSFYYSDTWFKRALSFNTGFDVRYFSNFNLPYYNPVIGQFYNQNTFSYNLYPTIDFFINCKIQTAILFFKVEYLNQNWFQRGYYTAVNYAAPDYTFRGGVSWRFFD